MKNTIFAPQRRVGSYCYCPEGDSVVVNYNSRLYDLDEKVALFQTAKAIDIAWWENRYPMWILIRPDGGDWLRCWVCPEYETIYDNQKRRLYISITNADDNVVVYMMEIELPYEVSDAITKAFEDLVYSTVDPFPGWENGGWITEYHDSYQLTTDELLKRCNRVFRASVH